MAVATGKSAALSPKRTAKTKSCVGKKVAQVTRGRSKIYGLSERTPKHSPKPTRCLRGVSTRATFKRSPSPRRDWPFGGELITTPHIRSISPNPVSHVSTSPKIKTANTRPKSLMSSSTFDSKATSIYSNVSKSPITPRHSPKPTRCLRGVSTRATFKRSPSPRRDWPFDEALLYPPSPKSSHSAKFTTGTKVRTNSGGKTLALSKGAKSPVSEKVCEPPKNPKKALTVGGVKSPSGGRTKTLSTVKRLSGEKVLSPKKSISTLKSLKKTVTPGKNSKVRKPISISKAPGKRFQVETQITDCKDVPNSKGISGLFDMNYETESIATVLDGEEEYVQSPVTSLHIGWGGNLMKSSYWSKKTPGEFGVQINKGILWTEVHKGSLVWKPHKCINDFRLVSHSRELYNPYPGSTKLEVAEYIWEFNDYSRFNLIGNQRFPALFELLFVKKDPFLTSLFGKFYKNPLSHDIVCQELFTQALLMSHPNFVRINEVIENDSLPFSVFVMEYLPHSSMIWNPVNQIYEAPSISKLEVNHSRVYTIHGSKLILSQIVEAIKFLHSRGIFGIFMRPESIKLSHSLDETFKDNKNKLTKLISHTPSSWREWLDRNKRKMPSKIRVDDDIGSYWKNSESIQITGYTDFNSIKQINEFIQQTKSESSNREAYSLLVDPTPFRNDIEQFLKHSSSSTNQSNDVTLHVKLSSIFKGVKTNNRDYFLSAPRWVSPPELYSYIFNNNKPDVDLRKCDIWNIGVLLHCFLTGTPPRLINNKIILNQYIPSGTKDVLLSLLSIDPAQRPAIIDIPDLLALI